MPGSAARRCRSCGRGYRILRNLFIKARRLSEPNWEAGETARRLGLFQGIDKDAMFKLLKSIDKRFPLPVPCCDDITDAMDPIINRIMALPATTIYALTRRPK